jgi:hypothetical protein
MEPELKARNEGPITICLNDACKFYSNYIIYTVHK